MHDLFIVGVPLLAILAGIFFNNSRLDKFEARTESRFDRIDSRLDRMDGRFDRIQADLSQFYSITGKHEIRMDVLEKRQDH